MTDGENDERILDLFRKWLQETREEAAAAAGQNDAGHAATPSPGFGLDRLVGEFTALRQEIKLQTKSSRTLEERVEASLAALADASAHFKSAAATASASGDKTLATTLAELDEALDRGGEQWRKNAARLTGPATSPAAPDRLKELQTGLSWWQRRSTTSGLRRLCERIEEAEEKSRHERQALLTALLSGYGLIQQRLARAMANAGVIRIPTVGRLVDPEQMVVVEVVDAEGPAGQVVEEIRRGYTWQGGLLRPAEVRAIRPRFEQENPN